MSTLTLDEQYRHVQASTSDNACLCIEGRDVILWHQQGAPCAEYHMLTGEIGRAWVRWTYLSTDRTR